MIFFPNIKRKSGHGQMGIMEKSGIILSMWSRTLVTWREKHQPSLITRLSIILL